MGKAIDREERIEVHLSGEGWLGVIKGKTVATSTLARFAAAASVNPTQLRIVGLPSFIGARLEQVKKVRQDLENATIREKETIELVCIQLHERGISYSDIGLLLGFSRQYAHRIVQRRSGS